VTVVLVVVAMVSLVVLALTTNIWMGELVAVLGQDEEPHPFINVVIAASMMAGVVYLSAAAALLI